MPIIAIAILLMVLGGIPAYAQSADPPDDGNSWLKDCGVGFDSSTADILETFTYGMCLGRVKGFVEMNEIYEAMGAIQDGRGFCRPEGVPYGQVLRVINKYLENNPAVLHRRWDLLAYVALKTAFPCASGKPAP